MKRAYRVTYRIDHGAPGQFTDLTLTVDHLPLIDSVVSVPDGSGRYGRVISVERA